MGKALMILNEPAYGSERAYNGLRLAGAMAKRAGTQMRVFLIGDAVACAKRGQRVPGGYYSLEAMLGTVLQHHGEVGVCGLLRINLILNIAARQSDNGRRKPARSLHRHVVSKRPVDRVGRRKSCKEGQDNDSQSDAYFHGDFTH